MKGALLSCGILLALSASGAGAKIPSTVLYPFPGYDLDDVRAKTRAESGPNSGDLDEAWHLYREIQGAWAPGHSKPTAGAIARLDELKGRLQRVPKPAWFSGVLDSPGSVKPALADRIGDSVFEAQRVSPAYLTLKALALVYLSEHELDRPGSAKEAGRFLAALAVTHPWDWQVHGLYGRFLLDAQLNGPAWEEAKLSLFLNPEPGVDELKFFFFVGSISAKEKRLEMDVAVREAVADDSVAEQAITESEILFSAGMTSQAVPPRDR